MALQEKDIRKQMVVSLVVFLFLLMLTLLGLGLTSTNTFRFHLENYLIRVFLIPVVLFFFGCCLAKMNLYFWGRPKRISAVFSHWVKILFICLLSVNIVIVIPHVIWYLQGLLQKWSGVVEISMIFPYVPGYSETVGFFMSVMLKFPCVYILPGFCIGAFSLIKRYASSGSGDLPPT